MRLDLPRSPPTLLVFHPDMAEQVYRLEGRLPTRPAFHAISAAKHQQGLPPHLQGVLTTNGEAWRGFRSKVQRVLLLPGSVGEHRETVGEVTEQLVGRLEQGAELRGALYRWALEAMGAVALDTRLGCLGEGGGRPEALAMVELVHQVLDTHTLLGQQGTVQTPLV